MFLSLMLKIEDLVQRGFDCLACLILQKSERWTARFALFINFHTTVRKGSIAQLSARLLPLNFIASTT